MLHSPSLYAPSMSCNKNSIQDPPSPVPSFLLIHILISTERLFATPHQSSVLHPVHALVPEQPACARPPPQADGGQHPPVLGERRRGSRAVPETAFVGGYDRRRCRSDSGSAQHQLPRGTSTPGRRYHMDGRKREKKNEYI